MEEISRLEAVLEKSDTQALSTLQTRIDHLKTCIAASLPDQVLNTNIAGPMADSHFPYEERLLAEIDPSYWSPSQDKTDRSS